MIYQQLAADTLSTAVDSLTKSADQSLNQITFDISRALTTDNLLIPTIGYVVVFLALLFLYLIFNSITKLLQTNIRKRLRAKGKVEEATTEEIEVSGEINAAISMALYLHFNEIHDFENTVLTIKKVQKSYSPWSSKIYGLREYPTK